MQTVGQVHNADLVENADCRPVIRNCCCQNWRLCSELFAVTPTVYSSTISLFWPGLVPGHRPDLGLVCQFSGCITM
ncbi:hypothetical protein pdam_00015942 [Pocillopora damicornis]|uniref:Uncharacterized protein n=1 Tax=Pocillopora damicornis TaxID=46731 RepID=A0A3M6TH77_POCDA|nr:hypothetical protein pdam_00015942 [Pocillopora damicornis]